MTRAETLNTRSGDFTDLLNCHAISQGSAKQKPPKKKWNIFDVLAMK